MASALPRGVFHGTAVGGVSLASGPRPPACTRSPSLSPLQWCLRHGPSRLAVERLPPASGTNPRLSEGAPGPQRLLPAPSLSLFSPSRGPGCALRPAAPWASCSFPLLSLLVAPEASQDSGALRILSLECGPSQTPDVYSGVRPCSLAPRVHRGATLSECDVVRACRANTVSSAIFYSWTPILENCRQCSHFHVCFHFSTWPTHAPLSLGMTSETRWLRATPGPCSSEASGCSRVGKWRRRC